MGEVANIGSGGVATRRSKLGISPEQEAFTREQVDALKKMNGWRDVPDAELSVFFHQCQRTGLDPFAKQVYLIGRRGKNGMQYTIQTSIDGMRLIADRTNRYAGSDRPKFGEEDGDRYAEITVYKLVGNPATRVAFTGVAFESEFKDERSPMWKKMPKTMLSKCAESVALRKAFPADLSGIYGQEEMEQAGPPVAPSTAASHHDNEVVEAEVVEQGQSEPESQGNASGASSGKLAKNHQAMVDEVERLLKQTPDGFFDDSAGLLRRARQSFQDAMSVRREIHEQISEGKPSEPSDAPKDESGSDDVAEIEKMSGGAPRSAPASQPRAMRSQVDLLKTLLSEARGDDGVERMEAHIGKSITELTRTEVEEWIDRFAPETGAPAEDSPESSDDEDEAEDSAEASASGSAKGRPNKNDLPATRKQLNYLESLVADAVEDGVSKFEEMAGKRIAELTREEASEWIGRLSGKATE